jgi:Domain of unknown function (DUF927)
MSTPWNSNTAPQPDAATPNLESDIENFETPEVMPEGWQYDDTGRLCLVRALRRGVELDPVYTGKIAVIGSSQNAFDGVASWQVRFQNRGRPVIIEAPRLELSRKKGCLEMLSARGASVHEENAAKVARFLTEYATVNEDHLPHEVTANRYGFTTSGALVTPSGSISADGTPEAIRFVSGYGAPAARIGNDRDAYREALREVLSWGSDAWVVLCALGFALSSPFLEHFTPRRNPVLYFAGDSGAGKTTAARFAVGAWGVGAPLEMELGRTTKAGMLQTLEGLGGLPMLGDEAHSTPDPAMLEGTVYQFANGQSYTKGGKDGRALGGVVLRGAMLLAGEALPDFVNAGAHRRLLFIRVSEHKPLGAAVGSALGAQRAAILERAWNDGAGWCGETFARGVMSERKAFTALVAEYRQLFTSLGAWDVPLAAMIASVKTLCRLYDLKLPEDTEAALIGTPPAILEGSRQEHEPAVLAWEEFTTLLESAKTTDGHAGAPAFKEIRGERIAWRKHGEPWRVMYNAKPICDVMGGKRWIERCSSEWLRRQWIRPSKEGKAYHNAKPPGGSHAVWVLVLESEKDSPQGGAT